MDPNNYYDMLGCKERLKFYDAVPLPETSLFDLVVKHQKYHHLSREELYRSYPPSNIVMFSHTPNELARTIQNFVGLSKKGLTDAQKAGIQKYAWLCKLEGKVPEDDNLLFHYYNAFDQIFFFGALENLCDVKFRTFAFMEFMGRLGSTETTTGACDYIFTISILNIISLSSSQTATTKRLYQDFTTNPLSKDSNFTTSDRMTVYKSTLLHEMLHAYMMAYACKCSLECELRFILDDGPWGHGPAWEQAALDIEDASERLLGERLDLGAEFSAEIDSLNADRQALTESTESEILNENANLRFASAEGIHPS